MDIHLKFYLGDYCFILQSDKILEVKVIGIKFDFILGEFENNKQYFKNEFVVNNYIYYHLETKGGATFTKVAEKVFKTKEDLLKSL